MKIGKRPVAGRNAGQGCVGRFIRIFSDTGSPLDNWLMRGKFRIHFPGCFPHYLHWAYISVLRLLGKCKITAAEPWKEGNEKLPVFFPQLRYKNQVFP